MMFSPSVISAFDELMLAESHIPLSTSTTSTSETTSESSSRIPEYFDPLHSHPSNSPYSSPPCCTPETLSPTTSHEATSQLTALPIPSHIHSMLESLQTSPSSSAASSREVSPTRKQVHFALEVEEHEFSPAKGAGKAHRHWLFHSHLHSHPHEHSEHKSKAHAKSLDGIFSLVRKNSMRKISAPLEAMEAS